ncbi:MAG: uncharacterized protein JWO95_2512 [Verrucomicrobiales bacterium]|nr:uncharacterized protein [Verrucomicrobiales bacterium]
MPTQTLEPPTTSNRQKVEQLARDLRRTPPRSPRETLGGLVIAARMVDKARADILGINGEYNFFPCGLGAFFWKFTGLDAMKFREFVATGATDQQVDQWLRANATQKDPKTIIKWNNEMRCLRLSELPDQVQEYFETYIPQFCHPPSKVKFFFDVYDVEEGVL